MMFQITEDFEEIPVQSRGLGILDVGYRSTVTIISFDIWARNLSNFTHWLQKGLDE